MYNDITLKKKMYLKNRVSAAIHKEAIKYSKIVYTLSIDINILVNAVVQLRYSHKQKSPMLLYAGQTPSR